jgi:hypothetical protein
LSGSLPFKPPALPGVHDYTNIANQYGVDPAHIMLDFVSPMQSRIQEYRAQNPGNTGGGPQSANMDDEVARLIKETQAGK